MALSYGAFVGDDLAIIGQAAGGDGGDEAANLADILNGFRQGVDVCLALNFSHQGHGVLFPITGYHKTRTGDLGMAFGDFGDLGRIDEHALDLGALVGTAHPPLFVRPVGQLPASTADMSPVPKRTRG